MSEEALIPASRLAKGAPKDKGDKLDKVDGDKEKPRKRKKTSTNVSRKRTLKINRKLLEESWAELGGKESVDRDLIDRPTSWGQCQERIGELARDRRLGTEPSKNFRCAYAGCRHHNYLDVNDTGSITINRPAVPLEQMEHPCSLLVAMLGGQTLEEVGEILNLTRERVRQIEVRAIMRKLRNAKF